jgi:hypothetical protein
MTEINALLTIICPPAVKHFARRSRQERGIGLHNRDTSATE